MSSESGSTDTTALSPRAGIALLTLQLRAAMQEAAEAEADAVAVDLDAARDLLRARLAPMLDERRRALDDTLAATRTEAARAVAAAHRAASVIVAHARPVELPLPEIVDAPPPLPEPAADPVVEESAFEVEPAVDADDDVEPAAETVVEAVADPQPMPEQELDATLVAAFEADLAPEPEPDEEPEPEPAPAAVVAPLVAPLTAPVVPAAPVTVVIDAEAFARVFATVFASIMDDRQRTPGWSTAPQVFVPAPPSTPAKQSFWTHARHPDVLLMGVATVIVLVVLAAWLG
ncbi:MAG: hypothetical protein Q8M22_13110 [Actinomycetota bacterium]|nr:hypothetical protein [Actinomycetota bacterium]